MVRTNFPYKLLVALGNFCHINLMKFKECKVLHLDWANSTYEYRLGEAIGGSLEGKS